MLLSMFTSNNPIHVLLLYIWLWLSPLSFTQVLEILICGNLTALQIGAFAAPDRIHWAPGLPKTRSGKIMRRILRKIASKQLEELGDISTLAEPAVVDQLIALNDC